MPLCQDGLSLADMEALTAEGNIYREGTMDPKFADVLRSVLMSAGAMAVYFGLADAGMVTAIVGGVMAVVSVVWSFKAHA